MKSQIVTDATTLVTDHADTIQKAYSAFFRRRIDQRLIVDILYG